MNAKKNMKDAAVKNVRILFIFPLKNKRKNGKELTRAGTSLINQRQDYDLNFLTLIRNNFFCPQRTPEK